MRVGIIGGGFAGLAAAYELSNYGHQVAVFEKAPFLGGQASTFAIGGQQIERGYHHLFTSDRDMINLMDELGLRDKLEWIESKVGIFCQNRVWAFGTPMDLLRFKPISLIARLRLGLVTLHLQRRKHWADLEKIPATRWAKKFAGKAAYEAVLEPMLRGKFGSYFEDINMAWLWNKFALRVSSRGSKIGKERLGYPSGSFATVIEATAKRICEAGGEVHASASVDGLLIQNGQAKGLTVSLENGKRHDRNFDSIIATVPSFIFAKLLPSQPPHYLEQLQRVNYLAAVLITLVLDRPLTQFYWLNIADREIPFLGVIEHTNLVGPENYGGRHIIYISNYLDKEDPMFGHTKEELLAEYIPYLKRINPAFKPSWIQESYQHREAAAQPVVTTNYSERIPAHKTPIEGLYLANTTQIYPEDRGTNYSIRLGRTVARIVHDNG